MSATTNVFAETFGEHSLPHGSELWVTDPGALHDMKEDYMNRMPRGLLLGELALAKAPYTGKQTACVVETLDEHRESVATYSGHTEERAPGDFESAIMMALKGIVDERETIWRVSIAGNGMHKAKHLMPSCADYEALKTHMEPLSPYSHPVDIALLAPDTHDDVFIVNRADIERAYEPKPLSNMAGMEWEEYDPPGPLSWLEAEDGEFLHSAQYLSRKYGFDCFLTGSASFRGPSTALKHSYDDLDLIAITDQDRTEVEELFHNTAEYYYGPMSVTKKYVTVWDTGRVVEGVCMSNDRQSIDLFVASRFADAFVRPENIPRNFFHKL